MVNSEIRTREDTAQLLAEGKRLTGLPYEELWRRYREAAGFRAVGLTAFKGYFTGSTSPKISHWELIARTLNEALEAAGASFRVPRLNREDVTEGAA